MRVVLQTIGSWAAAETPPPELVILGDGFAVGWAGTAYTEPAYAPPPPLRLSLRTHKMQPTLGKSAFEVILATRPKLSD